MGKDKMMTRLSQELRAPVVSHDVKLIPSDQTLKWLELGRHPQYATDNDATTRRDIEVSEREGGTEAAITFDPGEGRASAMPSAQ